MNKKFMISIFLAVVMMCFGCSKKIPSKNAGDTYTPCVEDPYKPYVEEKLRIKVDNDTPLKQLLTKEYELSEFQLFFGNDAATGGFIQEYADIQYHSSYDILEKFPIECLRYKSNTYYSVYKIKNGGYYYIIWNGSQSIPINGDLTVLMAMCVNTPPSLATFRKLIKRNKTTVGEILDAAPETVMDFMASSGPYSYSLLEDMRVLIIRYCIEDSKEITRDHLIVKDFDIVSLDSIFAGEFNIIREDICFL